MNYFPTIIINCIGLWFISNVFYRRSYSGLHILKSSMHLVKAVYDKKMGCFVIMI